MAVFCLCLFYFCLGWYVCLSTIWCLLRQWFCSPLGGSLPKYRHWLDIRWEKCHMKWNDLRFVCVTDKWRGPHRPSIAKIIIESDVYQTWPEIRQVSLCISLPEEFFSYGHKEGKIARILPTHVAIINSTSSASVCLVRISFNVVKNSNWFNLFLKKR